MTTWDADGWNDYVGAARRLDQLRRDAIAAVAAQQAAADEARERIESIRQRAAGQRAAFDAAATRLAVPSADLDVADPNGEAAAGADADRMERVAAALDRAETGLDEAGECLAELSERPARTGLLGRWPAFLRNGLVYFWYALLALIAIVEIDHVGGPTTRAAIVVAVFAVALPAVAWVVGWLSVRVLFDLRRRDARTGADGSSPSGDTRANRSVLLGVALNVIPLVVGLLLARS